MLPQLSPLNGGLAGAPVQVPPPPRFRAPAGKITDVVLKSEHPFRDQRGNTAAKHAGILYERKVQEFLSDLLGPYYFSSPILHFRDESGARTCIPDGLLIRYGCCVIFEVKSQHMPEAWWQLRRLYEPVVRAYLPHSQVALLEVVRSYDPATPFPERPTVVYDLRQYVEVDAKDKSFGVFRWKS